MLYFCIIYLQYGRTERVGNNLNPEFSKSISMNYYFEMVQKLKFTVYDVDNETKKLNDDDYLGSMECTLGQVSMYTIHVTNKIIGSHFCNFFWDCVQEKLHWKVDYKR